jgi:hypothetical protein
MLGDSGEGGAVNKRPTNFVRGSLVHKSNSNMSNSDF